MLEKRIGVIMYQTSNSKGQELVAQRMVRDFNKLGQKAYLITGTYHDGKEVVPSAGLMKDKGYYCIHDEVLGIPVIRVESILAKWPPRRIAFKDFISTLNQIMDDFDLNVLITHSTLWNGPEETAKFVTWRRDMKFEGGYRDPIVFCHMSHFQEPSKQRYTFPELTFRSAWNKMSLSKILETANLVLTVTPLEKKINIKMGAKAEKCVLYPGGVDTEAFLRCAAGDADEFLIERKIPAHTHIISYLGTIEDRKNPMAVLKVAQKMKDRTDIHFVIAGSGDSDYGRDVLKLARELPNVTYLGEITEKEKALLIRASYLNILLSKLEALGISQLEFMYCGVPVITSAAGGQAWLVQDGVEGIHVKNADDVDGAVKAISRLIEDKALYKQLSVNAREKAGRYASIRLNAELDDRINQAMMVESGLYGIPNEMRSSLSKPEYVLKSWTSGTCGVVATNRRIFIRRGWISKSVISMRYYNIKAIEYMKHYPWKVPLNGALLSCAAYFIPSLQNILAEGIVNKLGTLFNNLMSTIPPQYLLDGWTLVLLPLLPFLISLGIFFAQSRKGFRLYGAGDQPIYLSGRFKKAIEFIREVQDKDPEKLQKTELSRETLESLINSN